MKASRKNGAVTISSTSIALSPKNFRRSKTDKKLQKIQGFLQSLKTVSRLIFAIADSLSKTKDLSATRKKYKNRKDEKDFDLEVHP